MTDEGRQRTLLLSLRDRFMVLEVLPQQSNLVDQILSRDIRGLVEPSQDELKTVGFKADGQNLSWDDSKATQEDITFSEAELNLISRMFKLANDEQRVTPSMLDTILKFQKITGV